MKMLEVKKINKKDPIWQNSPLFCKITRAVTNSTGGQDQNLVSLTRTEAAELYKKLGEVLSDATD